MTYSPQSVNGFSATLHPLDRVLDALHYTGPRNGQTVNVNCPTHDDKRASLSISMGNNGAVVMNCHAGCRTDAVLQAIGLTMADLFVNSNGAPTPQAPGNVTAKPTPKATVTGWKQPAGSTLAAVYDYVDAGGGLLYQVGRFALAGGDKTFRQRQPDGNGQFIGSVTNPPVQMVLYRLPELLAADPDAWIYLCEGEKDADNVTQLGAVATTNACGAQKWEPAFTQTLLGRNVCIVEDNDPGGHKRTQMLLGALQGQVKEVVVLKLPGLGDKEDISDWIQRGGTLAELQQLTLQAKQGPATATGNAGKLTKSETLLQDLQGLGKTFRLNQLEDNIEVDGALLDDYAEAEINLKLIDGGHSRPNIKDAMRVLASRDAYDPIHDYLNGLKWDGQNHVGELARHMTGDGTMVNYGDRQYPLHAALIGRWLTGAVARGLNRGNSVFNHQTPMLVLIGPQEIGKSSWARWLTSGIGSEYRRESPLDPHSVEHQRSAVTKWIWEVSELGSSLRRNDRDSLKAFITQEWFTYRKPWDTYAVTKPMLCNLVGTLNQETGFLDDPTGHRRFLPVVLNAIDHDYDKVIDVNQLWAQVVHEYKAGNFSPELHPAEREALKGVYAQHEIENPLQTYMHMYFDIDPDNPLLRCHTATIIERLQAFHVKLPASLKVAGREINDVLAPMGLTSGQFHYSGNKGRGWIGIAPNAKVPPIYNGFNKP